MLSLTVSEPGALKLAGTPAGEEMIAHGERLYAARDSISPADFLRFFRSGTGSSRATPEELPEELLRGAELAMAERPSWEADVPLDALAAAGFPVLAISGGHSPVFEAVCDNDRRAPRRRARDDRRPRPQHPRDRRPLQRTTGAFPRWTMSRSATSAADRRL